MCFRLVPTTDATVPSLRGTEAFGRKGIFFFPFPAKLERHRGGKRVRHPDWLHDVKCASRVSSVLPTALRPLRDYEPKIKFCTPAASFSLNLLISLLPIVYDTETKEWKGRFCVVNRKVSTLR
jgi:hypothetical protein